MASSFQAAVTPAGIRDGDPAALAALVERRANAVLAYCEAVCPPGVAERAAAEAFARFRAAVATAEDPRELDPETLLRGATRHAAASMTITPELPTGGLRGKLAAGRGTASETCALIPDLLAARADGLLGVADRERLSRHLERHAACRALAVAVDRAEVVYASPPPRTVPIGALTEIMLALAAAAPITAAPTADLEWTDVLLAEPEAEEQAPPPVAEPEGDRSAPARETDPPDPGADAHPPEPETRAQQSEAVAPESEAVAPEYEPAPAAAGPPAPPPENHQPEPEPPEPQLHHPAAEPPQPPLHQPAADRSEPGPYGPEAQQSAPYHPAPRQPAFEPRAETDPETRPAQAHQPGALGPSAYQPGPGAGTALSSTALASTPVEDHTAHTLVLPAAAVTGATAAPPRGVPLPRPPRRPLHRPSASGHHGVVYRYVLPGAAVAAALVAAMGVAGVFGSDDRAPPAAPPVSTSIPAAPPTGAPPVTPRTDVEAEERAAMAAQRRARRERAAAAARRRKPEVTQSTVPATPAQTVPPAAVTPEPDPEPAPAPARTTPRKPARTVEAQPPADSSSAPPGTPPPGTGTETTPPAPPGVFEGTPAPSP
ncbi:MAG: hypothetical protein AVDCRST_MAG53-1240 [uncultured Solirubrobacteraceae bacterium]|uniref:Uncharacterized protein n=1 Tax=uncultured Solirubrobacteraceae bacterium TaxID=1162706 RepID=A0A6J4RMT7_9ACTN|nr:MAG: hypothetical protein AVDCRST_MAG53-1240 [uncultured Solirubrobacteraceae bacterium]